jgi:hypothetical protein
MDMSATKINRKKRNDFEQRQSPQRSRSGQMKDIQGGGA